MGKSWLWAVMVAVVLAGCGGGAADQTTSESSENPPESDGAAAAIESGEGGDDAEGAGEEVASGGQPGEAVDACRLVDANAAATILGAPAHVDNAGIGGFGETSLCGWVTDTDALLVVSVFDGAHYYGGGLMPGAEPLDFGDDGYITVEPNFGGVDMQVVEGNWVVSLSAAPFGIADVDSLPDSMKQAASDAVDTLP